MSDIVRALEDRRDAWPHLSAVYDWAISEAHDAERRAQAVVFDAMRPDRPYPVIVELLACVPLSSTCTGCSGTGELQLGVGCPECDGSGTVQPLCACEYTPSGHFAFPCYLHACAQCGHLAHDEDGCGHPDPITGWCECEAIR